MSKKIFYLSSEVEPFSNTYSLSQFSQKVCSKLHNIPDFDIRLNQPKYGYISERKYILREVIRLRDMLIDFSDGQDSVNLKSAFIPNTRVQIYFTESEKYFKPTIELLYKAYAIPIFSSVVINPSPFQSSNESTADVSLEQQEYVNAVLKEPLLSLDDSNISN